MSQSSNGALLPVYSTEGRIDTFQGLSSRRLLNRHVEILVRSGGHTNWAGSNNIPGGVTVR